MMKVILLTVTAFLSILFFLLINLSANAIDSKYSPSFVSQFGNVATDPVLGNFDLQAKDGRPIETEESSNIVTETTTIIEHRLPVSPTNIYMDQQGVIWFSSFYGNSIGNLDPNSQDVNIYIRKEDGGNVWAIEQDQQGNFWYTTVNQLPKDVVGKFDVTTNMFTEWTLSASRDPIHFGMGIDLPTGDIWFTNRGDAESDLPGIYRLKPSTNQVDFWSTLPYTDTYDLNIDPGGNIWVTVQPTGLQGVLRLNPFTNELTSWEMPINYSRPFRIFAQTPDEIWFSEISTQTNSIAKLTPSTDTLLEYRIAIANSAPTGFIVNGNRVWANLSDASSIGRLHLTNLSPVMSVLNSNTVLVDESIAEISVNSYEAVTTFTSSVKVTGTITTTTSNAFTHFRLPTFSRPFDLLQQPTSREIWFSVGEISPDLTSEFGYIGLLIGSGDEVLDNFLYLPIIVKN